jgi:uncharacterized protein with PQ loop repeat
VTALTHLLLLIGVCSNLAAGVPQVRRTVLQRRTDGLSALGMWTGVNASALWLCYSLTVGDRLLLCSNVLTLGINVSILVAHRRYSASRVPVRLDATALLLVTVWAGACLAGASALLSLCGSVTTVVLGLPQLARIAAAPNTGGVARATYVMAVIGNASWAAYWALRGEPVVAASNVWGLAVASTGLTLLTARPLVAARVRRVPGARRVRAMLPATA